MDATKKFIVEEIKKNPVTVFAKSGCPYCKMTKARLEDLGAKFEYILVQRGPDGDNAIQSVFNSEDLFGSKKALKEEHGLILKKYQRTVPNIWIGEEQIGGCDDFEGLTKEEAVEKLKAAGAL